MRDVKVWQGREKTVWRRTWEAIKGCLGHTTWQYSPWIYRNKAANKAAGRKSHTGDCLTEQMICPKQFKARFYLQRSKKNGLMLFEHFRISSSASTGYG